MFDTSLGCFSWCYFVMMNGDDDELDTHEIDVHGIWICIMVVIKMLEYLYFERYLAET